MGWVVNATPRPLYPPGKTRYPLCRRLGRPQARSGLLRKISPPPGFDPRTVQPVASRYPGPPVVTSIVRKCREITDILSLPFGVVVFGEKDVTQQLAGKQQVLSHVTVASAHETALEWPLMFVRAADRLAHCLA